MDVWVVLWIKVFEFWMECCIAGAGQTGIAIIDLDEGITVVEVGVVVVSWQPTRSCAGRSFGASTVEYILIV